jgi:hypothetical protein
MAILGALPLPALSKAKAKSSRIVSLSNLKQLQTGRHFYTVDNNDWMPLNRYDRRARDNTGSTPGSMYVRG